MSSRNLGSLPSAAEWSTMEPLVDAALALPENERLAYLDKACAGNSELRERVDRLISLADAVPDLMRGLERPAAERFASLLDDRLDDEKLRESLAERFTVGRRLGNGGMATVYHAIDRGSARALALKVMRPLPSEIAVSRFRREIMVATSLCHRNIVAPIESGMCEERLWYSMRFIDGESVGQRLRRTARLGTSEVLHLLRGIASALGYAHQLGIIHRDLKPDNVLIDRGEPVLVDFGVAKALWPDASDETGEPSTATGVSIGTPAYMSPEQAAGEKMIDHRADLYSLGVVAYHFIAGSTPFTGGSRQALLTAHLAQRPTDVGKHRPDVPAELRQLVMQLLEKRREDRPANAEEVINRLERITPSSVSSIWPRLSNLFQ